MTSQRCVGAAWKVERRVRILACDFGYKGKIGEIRRVGAERVYVHIKLGKKPGECDEVAYPPESLRLI